MKRSPLAPKTEPVLPPLAGVRMASMAAGIKYQGRDDLLMMVFDEAAPVAGVFTRSRCPSAPVDWCRDRLSANEPRCRTIVVNSGNANAFTGKRGADATALTAGFAAKALGCREEEIMLASTGVIGEPLDVSEFGNHLENLKGNASGDGWAAAARTIMTTDTYPKLASASLQIDGQTVTINGIAKGSGMIAPDMATMLAFIVTDAKVVARDLQGLLDRLTGPTFNSITVDSDTSTSDTLLLAATGTSASFAADSEDGRAFEEALRGVMEDLALQIVRDGEGASKLMDIRVTGAVSDGDALQIALSIGNSPLVKTAVAGEDANWGRIVMAVGKAGAEADRDRLAIFFGDVRVAVNGERDPDYSEEAASVVMKGEEITITVDLGLGTGSAQVWACDLTKDYVAINGDYRS